MRAAELKKLEELALAATQGEWTFINHNNEVKESTPSDDWSIRNPEGKVICSEPSCGLKDLPDVCNGEYIAAAGPATMLNLIAQIKRQYAENQRQAALLQDLRLIQDLRGKNSDGK